MVSAQTEMDHSRNWSVGTQTKELVTDWELKRYFEII